MDTGLLEVRNVTYRAFVELGRAPSAEEVAGAADRTSAEVEAVWRELHRAHGERVAFESFRIRGTLRRPGGCGLRDRQQDENEGPHETDCIAPETGEMPSAARA